MDHVLKTLEPDLVWQNNSIKQYLEREGNSKRIENGKFKNVLICPNIQFGCEAWALKQDDQNRIHAVEMWLLRHLLRVSWKEK